MGWDTRVQAAFHVNLDIKLSAGIMVPGPSFVALSVVPRYSSVFCKNMYEQSQIREAAQQVIRQIRVMGWRHVTNEMGCAIAFAKLP